MKVCKKCGKEKPDLDFGIQRNSNTGRETFKSTCNACRAAIQNKLAHSQSKRLHLYDLTDLHHMMLVHAQDNCCAICNISFSLDGVKECVDHDKITGNIRGLLCNECNLGLGKFNHDPDVFEKIAPYLRKGNTLLCS